MEIEWVTNHTKGIQEKYLYRFIDMYKLIDFLNTYCLYFSRMDKFDDKYEGITTYDIGEINIWEKINVNAPNLNPRIPKNVMKQKMRQKKSTFDRIKQSQRSRQKSHYANCWYLANRESVAMWDIYSKTMGVALKFERVFLQNLIKSKRNENNLPKHIYKLIAGKVRYQNFNVLPFTEKKKLVKYPAFRKDEAFAHEKEFRFILLADKPLFKQAGILFHLGDLKDLEFDIIVHPKMEKFERQSIQSLLDKYIPDKKLKDSELVNRFKLFD
ncbi:MAG: DUF2971 domain-containing protein [Bacteroidales bacterium]|nr:DUF2971 domain-containing protein [Bacteroidales bacterium]